LARPGRSVGAIARGAFDSRVPLFHDNARVTSGGLSPPNIWADSGSLLIRE
jgi:hypothetical protein